MLLLILAIWQDTRQWKDERLIKRVGGKGGSNYTKVIGKDRSVFSDIIGVLNNKLTQNTSILKQELWQTRKAGKETIKIGGGGVYMAKSKKVCRFLKAILVKSWTLPNEIINIMNFNFCFSKWHPERMYYIVYCSPYSQDSLSKTRDMQWENGAKNDGKVRTLVYLKSNKNDIRAPAAKILLTSIQYRRREVKCKSSINPNETLRPKTCVSKISNFCESKENGFASHEMIVLFWRPS